jgi:hypothetical protein
MILFIRCSFQFFIQMIIKIRDSLHNMSHSKNLKADSEDIQEN